MYGPPESCNGLRTTERFSRRVTSLVHNRGRNPNAGATGVGPTSVAPVLAGRRFLRLPGSRDRLRGQPVAAVVVGAAIVVVAVLFPGFENAQSQRRPEKPRVASVHLRPRPVALPHLR